MVFKLNYVFPIIDNDGVVNGADACKTTPNGAEVDSSGCTASERDGDMDGVHDDADQCPSTPALTAVDVLGCTKDVSPETNGGGGSQTSGGDDEVAGGGGFAEDNMMYIVAGIVALLVVAAAAVAWLGNKTPAPRLRALQRGTNDARPWLMTLFANRRSGHARPRIFGFRADSSEKCTIVRRPLAWRRHERVGR